MSCSCGCMSQLGRSRRQGRFCFAVAVRIVFLLLFVVLAQCPNTQPPPLCCCLSILRADVCGVWASAPLQTHRPHRQLTLRACVCVCMAPPFRRPPPVPSLCLPSSCREEPDL